MLKKTTCTYANPGLPIDCDIYQSDLYPSDSPVFLFFHSGGLVTGARTCIPPWLVQVCHQRQWPLISPSYRLLPQTGSNGLLQDAMAAYVFSQTWETAGNNNHRKVIVGGASAGFFMACLIAHNAAVMPLALLSITGIPTFRHSFFNSATLLTPEPVKDEDMADFINGPVEIGTVPEYDRTIFSVNQLLPSGIKNPNYAAHSRPADIAPTSKRERGTLYDYYLYKNAFLDLLGSVDPGFEWTNVDRAKLEAWPTTIFIQGNEDYDVSMDVTLQAAKRLGSEKAKLCLADGQGHLFEATSFLEDNSEGMDAVRNAIGYLDALLMRQD